MYQNSQSDMREGGSEREREREREKERQTEREREIEREREVETHWHETHSRGTWFFQAIGTWILGSVQAFGRGLMV